MKAPTTTDTKTSSPQRKNWRKNMAITADLDISGFDSPGGDRLRSLCMRIESQLRKIANARVLHKHNLFAGRFGIE